MAGKTKIRALHNVQPFEGYFEAVYAEFFKPLYRYARSIAKSDDLAKDVVSDVFFNLWKSGSDLSQIKELRSYLFRSVKNQVIRTLSYDPRSFGSIDTENHMKQIERVNPEEVLLEKELIEVIERAIGNLPDQCQLIFDMARNQQLTYAEISEKLNISQSTIKTQVSRAIAAIKHTIEIYYNDGDSPYFKYGMGGALLVILLLV